MEELRLAYRWDKSRFTNGTGSHRFSAVSDNGLYVNLLGGFPEYSEAILLQFESKILEFRMP
jgi:hypothetical protein